jgi:hypothetical protein
MAWITPHQVGAVLHTDLSGDPWIDDLIEHVEGLCEVEIGEQDEPISRRLAAVVTQIAARMWRAAVAAEGNPEGISQETIGAYSYSQSTIAALGLTNAEKDSLRKAVGRTGLWVQPTTRGPVETAVIGRWLDDEVLA